MDNITKIDQPLSFSWAHIFAFLALIFVAYISFLGGNYLLKGNQLLALALAFGVDIVLISLLIIPQQLKARGDGSRKKCRKRLAWERILIISAVVICPTVMMILYSPFAHFWSIVEDGDKVKTAYSNVLSQSTEMFVAYDNYAKERISNHDSVIAINQSLTASQKEVRKEALHIKLTSNAYADLKNNVNNEIAKAKDFSVWNVFELGNIGKLEKGISNWHNTLVSLSERKLSTEDSIEIFDPNNMYLSAAQQPIESLRSTYTDNHWSWMVFIIGVLCLFAIFLPYWVQDRPGKIQAAHAKLWTNGELSEKVVILETSSNEEKPLQANNFSSKKKDKEVNNKPGSEWI